jgi:hypothetical protein
MRPHPKIVFSALLCAVLLSSAMVAEDLPVHGLWVWKTSSILEAPRGAGMLRDFCRSAGINEVYVSVAPHGDSSMERPLVQLIALLHRSNIRVQALLSSTDADELGEPRQKLVGNVRRVLQFNRDHAETSFDGIHLDIEPQERPENKGPGNLRFLPGLVDAYRAVRGEAETARLPVNADIQTKLLKASLAQRQMLLSSLPRFNLMLYELSSPGDGDSTAQKTEKLRATSRKFLDMAYSGLNNPNLAQLVIALRTPDYGELMPQMLNMLDTANRLNAHYRGWAWHSYNDARDDRPSRR